MPHAVIDNKRYPMYLTCADRQHAARREVRGGYRQRGKAGLKRHLVKPKSTLKYPVQGVQVAAAVVKGRIRMWHYITGRWTGRKAAEMYKGPLKKCLAKAYPAGVRKSFPKWIVMEDNEAVIKMIIKILFVISRSMIHVGQRVR